MALTHYRAESHEQSVSLTHKMENSFDQMYQDLRTMARLPGVQNIDRHAKHFDANASTTVQEIDNNLATNVTIHPHPSTPSPDASGEGEKYRFLKEGE